MATNNDRFDYPTPSVNVATDTNPDRTAILVLDVPNGLDAGAPKGTKPISPLQRALKLLLHDRRALFSLGVLFLFVAIALIGPSIYQHIGSIYTSDLVGPIGPTVYHQYAHEELSQQDALPSARY